MTNIIMEFQTTQITAFKTSMEVIDSLISDTNLEVSASGIRIRETNRTSKLFVSVFFPADNFDTYTFSSPDTEFNVGIDIGNIVQLLKLNLHYDVLKFSLGDTQAIITLESFKRKEKKKLKLSLLKACPNTCGIIENTTYNHLVVLSSDLFSKYCKDISKVSDRVNLRLNRKEFIISSLPPDVEYVISGSSNNNITITTDITTKDYSEANLVVKFLLLVSKCSSISELVTIFVGGDTSSDTPCTYTTIRYNLGSLGILNLVLLGGLSQSLNLSTFFHTSLELLKRNILTFGYF
jgi:DNA polymerase III sliding clamp (beta) subunit (PCNA family)